MALFTREHAAFRERARRFVEDRLTPFADQWEARGEFPRSLFRDLAEEGYLGLGYGRAFGGHESDFGYDIVLAEELTRCRSTGLVLSVVAQNHFFLPLLSAHGTDKQKEAWMAPAIRGEKIGALASTEPDGGTDVAGALACTARDIGDKWVIKGEKKFITNAPIADFVVALVRTKNERTTTSLTLVIVPTDTPGFEVERLRTLGLKTSPTGWIRFNDCVVPKNLTLGKVNLGFFYASRAFLIERLVGSATAIALADVVVADTIRYARQRSMFGKRQVDLQSVRHRFSEMATEIEMARRFTYSVCESFSRGMNEAKEICMLKLHVGDMVQRVVQQCIQLHGGFGFLEDNWLSRVYRDIRFLSVGGGATEAMKDLVASYLRL